MVMRKQKFTKVVQEKVKRSHLPITADKDTYIQRKEAYLLESALRVGWLDSWVSDVVKLKQEIFLQ